MKPRKYAHIALAICISCLLLTVTGASVHFIYTADRANISQHILTRLQATTGLIKLWQQEYLMSVSSIASDPGLVDLVDKLINKKITLEQASTTMNEWLRPIYLGRGYEGHSVILPDHSIILASSPAYVGKQVSTASSREAIDLAFAKGVALARPSEAVYPVRMLDKVADAGTLYQLGCAQIKKGEKVLAVLCLRQDPYRNFFAMLATGFSGNTGETYAIDRSGAVISPTRFGHNIIRSPQQTGLASYAKGLQARVPTKTKNGAYLVGSKSPLTLGASMAMKNGESGFQNSYQDYRNIEVVGAAKWFPEMDIGIIVEQDVDEVYGPYQLARNAIIALGILATVLINTLLIAQHRSRKSLALREAHMRAFLNNFPGFAHMRSPDGKFMLVNDNMEKYLGVPKPQMINGDAGVLPFPPKNIQEINKEHEIVLNTGTVIEKIIQVSDIYAIDGIDWVKVVRFPVFESDSKDIHAVGTIMLDVSEQMHNAQALEKLSQHLEETVSQRTAQFEAAKQEAEQAAQVKAAFLANMSHEIRTPMNAIIGLSHLATMVSDDPKLRSYLQRIHQSGEHLLSIINDILDFSKIEAGKMTIEQTDFLLEDMLDKVIGLLWEKAENKGLELILQIAPDVPGNLKGDALRIGQVLINFLSNAVKFTDVGEVILRVQKISEDNKHVRLGFDVQDTGIGISTERFNQLFQPFQQLDTSSTRRYEGTGLGLAISKNLVELMGGRLNIQSAPGQGSTFSLELNLQKSGSPIPVIQRNTAPQDFRVLVADDNDHARQALVSILQNISLSVSEAGNGKEAIALALEADQKNKAFDMIFIDWKMPDMSGVETAESLLEINFTQPPKMVLMSAHSKQELGHIESSLAGIITKPVTPSAIYDLVSGLLKNACIKAEGNATLDINQYRQLAAINVLLVDDNDINQDVVKELLSLINTNITLASNGSEALEKLSQNTFDVVLMDMQMPVMDGIEATRRIRAQAQFKSLPIIAMTANVLTEDRELCAKVGMNDYISKPIDPETLFRTLLRWTQLTPKSEASPNITKAGQPHENLIQQLQQIDNFDPGPALERLLNNQDFYLKLIKRFVNERSGIVKDIRLALENGNFEEATRQAHTFKSLAGTIGATQLQELALQLELALRNGESNTELLLALEKALKILLEKLSAIFSG